jgi:alpha-tubulin suppressor-like RCC1 family protein
VWACSDSATPSVTEVIIVTDTDLHIPDEVTHVTFHVDSGAVDGRQFSRELSLVQDKPLSLGLIHIKGPLGPVTVRAVGTKDGQSVVSRAARFDFMPQQIKVLRLDLARICRGVDCGERSCNPDGGNCENLDDAGRPFAPWPGEAEPWSGSSCTDPEDMETCNGLDDDCDGEIDEGFELDQDPEHCGACGRGCAVEENCSARTCDGDHVAIAAGESFSCALLNSQELYCWGSNGSGQTGQPPTDDVVPPTRLEFDEALQSVVAGARHACALTTEGQVWCWGDDRQGQLGDGTEDSTAAASVRALLPEGVGAKALTAGSNHACAVLTTGDLYCWGANSKGQLGTFAPVEGEEPPASARPTQTLALPAEVIDVAAGGQHTCALVAETGGEPFVVCWGNNSSGQLGESFTETQLRYFPHSVTNLSEQNVTGLTASNAHSCALTADGNVLCWGRNHRGQLGDGTAQTTAGEIISTVRSPQDEEDLTGAIWLTAGLSHTCTVQQNGDGLCWGDDQLGQLGRGTGHVGRALIPTEVANLTDLFRLAAGTDHTCGLRGSPAEPEVWCWGSNAEGQLGQTDGTGNFTTPVRVPLP